MFDHSNICKVIWFMNGRQSFCKPRILFAVEFQCETVWIQLNREILDLRALYSQRAGFVILHYQAVPPFSWRLLMTDISKSHSISLEDDYLLILTINIAAKRKITNYSPWFCWLKKKEWAWTAARKIQVRLWESIALRTERPEETEHLHHCRCSRRG